MDFLKRPAAEPNVILLVDTSGSTLSSYEGEPLFNKFLKIALALQSVEQYRIIFWNSDTPGAFEGGIKKIPYVVTPKTISACFQVIRGQITQSCLTYPHLALPELETWLESGFSRTVYFLTDGQIGYPSCPTKATLQNKFVRKYKGIMGRFPDMQFHIISVESLARDFTVTESLASAAGSDIWRLISENGLTDTISEFVSYTPNHKDGYVHIRKIRPPPGHIPFRDGYFSEMHTERFISYIRNEIINHRYDEEYLIRLIQDITQSLAALTRGANRIRRQRILSHMSSLFFDTATDSSLVSYVLEDSVSKDAAGSSNLLTDYREQLRSLYKTADQTLHKSVARAIGVNGRDVVLSLPYNDLIIMSTAESMSHSLDGYENGCALVNGHIIPMFTTKHVEPMAEQCLRQWI